MCVKLLQSCLTLCDPVDYSPPGSFVHGILQARTLDWAAISSSRGSSPPSDQTRVSCISCIGKWTLYHCTAYTQAKDNSTDKSWGKKFPKENKIFHNCIKRYFFFPVISSVAQSCPTLCDCSSPGLPVHHQFPEFAQTHVH